MPKVGLYRASGTKIRDLELSEAVFGTKVNEALLYQALVTYRANQRSGTASTKRRGEVRGGGRKPWRQKGTGRARHGSSRSPIWRGGGVVFGPKPRSFKCSMPKKMKRQALLGALSDKAASGDLMVLDKLSLKEPSTKKMAEILNKLKLNGQKTLLVLEKPEINIQRSGRNIPEFEICTLDQLNFYQVLNSDKVVLTKQALSKIEETLS